jgi:hypothetical protein
MDIRNRRRNFPFIRSPAKGSIFHDKLIMHISGQMSSIISRFASPGGKQSPPGKNISAGISGVNFPSAGSDFGPTAQDCSEKQLATICLPAGPRNVVVGSCVRTVRKAKLNVRGKTARERFLVFSKIARKAAESIAQASRNIDAAADISRLPDPRHGPS